MKRIVVVLSLLITFSLTALNSAQADVFTFASFGAFSAFSTQYASHRRM